MMWAYVFNEKVQTICRHPKRQTSLERQEDRIAVVNQIEIYISYNNHFLIKYIQSERTKVNAAINDIISNEGNYNIYQTTLEGWGLSDEMRSHLIAETEREKVYANMKR